MAVFTIRVLTAELSGANRNIVDQTVRSLGAVYIRKIFPWFSELTPETGKSPSEIHYVLTGDGEETEGKLHDRIQSAISSYVSGPAAIVVRRDDDTLGLGISLGEELRSLIGSGQGFPRIVDLTDSEIEWMATWSGDNGQAGGLFYNHNLIQHYLLNTSEGENSWERLSAKLRNRKMQLVAGPEGTDEFQSL